MDHLLRRDEKGKWTLYFCMFSFILTTAQLFFNFFYSFLFTSCGSMFFPVLLVSILVQIEYRGACYSYRKNSCFQKISVCLIMVFIFYVVAWFSFFQSIFSMTELPYQGKMFMYVCTCVCMLCVYTCTNGLTNVLVMSWQFEPQSF